MGSSKKSQVDKKLVISENSIWASLKPVKTKLKRRERDTESEEEKQYSGSEEYCITPTAKEAKLCEKLICPPAPPRKRRPALKCRSNVNVEYFVPPSDLETVFIRRL
ncbi:unnamed protein product [Eruca vesicaria subsp. sativa]|uniref:Cyclin-dependent protein kinase inhibitor SMR13 n=1 Tax=Eruca vesicaria subsp. sativa TaxID=29727 RepID=A0ABC8KQK5_ERUVS|nr:unnamed protein product [Eruca vesicaria subsp. sativa]